MDALVGYTGFVGQNLYKAHKFDYVFNSKNIKDAYSLKPDLLVYAGVSAEMYLANNFPEKDMEKIKEAIDNIKKIDARKIVLISTISVYGEQVDGSENTSINKKQLTPYGKNRLYLEEWVQKNFEEYLIVRLPALYGEGLKKNFIYDYIHFIPNLLKKEKFDELVQKNTILSEYYKQQENGFYQCKVLERKEKKILINAFREMGFSALNFTDSRSEYQFYPLSFLWNHIMIALKSGLTKINLVTEPIKISELYYYLENHQFDNFVMEKPFSYNLKTEYAEVLGGIRGYIFDKEFVMSDIEKFVREKINEEQ